MGTAAIENRWRRGLAHPALNEAVQERISHIVETIRINQWGYWHPERDIRLLAALLLYPKANVATAASERLTQLLPESAVVQMDRECHAKGMKDVSIWLQQHADWLTWDPAEGRYRWEE